MDTFNDDDQAEQLKEWWKQNWQPILLGLGLSVGGVLGWNGWQSYRHAQAEAASGHYEQLRLSLGTGNLSAAELAHKTLIEDYSSSPYAVQSALAIAQQHINKSEFEQAEPYLLWAANEGADEKLGYVAGLRLARLYWQMGRDEDALKLLQGDDQEAFTGLYAELRGDILRSQGKIVAARAAYEAALEATMDPDMAGPTSDSLRVKLDDLALPPIGEATPDS